MGRVPRGATRTRYHRELASSGRAWLAVVAATVVALGCGGGLGPTQSATQTMAPDASATADLSAVPSPGSLDWLIGQDGVAVDTGGGLAGIASIEAATWSLGRERPRIPETLKAEAAFALDEALRGEAMQELVEDLGLQLGAAPEGGFTLAAFHQPLPGPVAEVPHSEFKGAITWSAVEAELHLIVPPLDPMAMPKPQSEASSEVSPDGTFTMSKSTYENDSISGSTVTIEREDSVKIEASEAVDGVTSQLRTSSTSRAKAGIGACPDKNGTGSGRVELYLDQTIGTVAGWEGVTGFDGMGATFEGSVDIEYLVDDEANLSGIRLAVTQKARFRGGTQDVDGTVVLDNDDVAMSQTISVIPSGDGVAAVEFGSTLDTVNGTDAADIEHVNDTLGAALRRIATYAVLDAQKAWRNGKCMSVTPDPEGEAVEAGSVTPITVKVLHRFGDGELDVPVTATLASGAGQVAPEITAIPAPADFAYTAGPNQGDEGQVIFRTVSKRGIAEERETYKVKPPPGVTVTIEGTYVATSPVLSGTFSVTAGPINLDPHGGGLTGSGQAFFKGKGTFAGFCTAPLDLETAVYIMATSAGASSGTTSYTLAFEFPDSDVTTVQMDCAGTPPLPQDLVASDLLDQWAYALGKVTIPARTTKMTASGSTSGGMGQGTLKVTATFQIRLRT